MVQWWNTKLSDYYEAVIRTFHPRCGYDIRQVLLGCLLAGWLRFGGSFVGFAYKGER